jgi:hypothetical protein
VWNLNRDGRGIAVTAWLMEPMGSMRGNLKRRRRAGARMQLHAPEVAPARSLVPFKFRVTANASGVMAHSGLVIRGLYCATSESTYSARRVLRLVLLRGCSGPGSKPVDTSTSEVASG